MLFYSPIKIIKIEPNTGAYSGGTEVFVEGDYLDVSYGGIWCKFGNFKVKATPVENLRLIKCESPSAIYAPIISQENHDVAF